MDGVYMWISHHQTYAPVSSIVIILDNHFHTFLLRMRRETEWLQYKQWNLFSVRFIRTELAPGSDATNCIPELQSYLVLRSMRKSRARVDCEARGEYSMRTGRGESCEPRISRAFFSRFVSLSVSSLAWSNSCWCCVCNGTKWKF